MLVSTKRGMFVFLDLTEDQAWLSVANVAHILLYLLFASIYPYMCNVAFL